MKIIIRLGAVALLMNLSACVMMPYEIPFGLQTAQLQVAKNVTDVWICDSTGIKKRLVASEGYATIPAGIRVSIGVNFIETGYNVKYSCSPRVSLIPSPNIFYFQDFETEAEGCTALIYRKAIGTPAGLEFEPSLSSREECRD